MDIKGWRAYGVVVLRVAIGLGLAYHGASTLFGRGGMAGFAKYVGSLGFPFHHAPAFWAYCAKLSEFAGGILLVLGGLTRPAALLIVITMSVAAFVANGKHPVFAPPREPSKEMSLLYLVCALTLFFTGPGPLALDPWLKGLWAGWKRKQREAKK